MSFTLEVITAEEYDAFMGLRVPTEQLEVSAQYNLMLRFKDRAYKAGRTVTRIAQLIPNPGIDSQLIMLHLGDEQLDTTDVTIDGLHKGGLLIPDTSTTATTHTGGPPNRVIGGYLLSRHEESLELVSVGAENDLSAIGHL